MHLEQPEIQTKTLKLNGVVHGPGSHSTIQLCNSCSDCSKRNLDTLRPLRSIQCSCMTGRGFLSALQSGRADMLTQCYIKVFQGSSLVWEITPAVWEQWPHHASLCNTYPEQAYYCTCGRDLKKRRKIQEMKLLMSSHVHVNLRCFS